MTQTILPNYMRKPATVPTWPPPGWEKQHLLQPGDNWAALRKRYARASDWDIIIFNFHTTSVAEVNWCMAYFLGCTEVTADRKSFKFGPARNLYIPPADWRPGMPVPQSGTPKANESDASKGRRTVIDVLKAADHQPFSFMLQGRKINTGMLRRVAKAIEDGKIGVVIDPLLPAGQAEYDSSENEFRIRSTSAPTREQRGLLIHEGIHAGMDLDTFGVVSVTFSEAAAYMAQVVYVRQRLTFNEILNKLRLYDEDSRVFDVAWPIAGKLLDRKPITSADEFLLLASIRASALYKNKIAADFDGV